MGVSVAPGTAAVPLVTAQGSALCRWDAPEVATVAAATHPAGQSRIDLIVVQVRDFDLDGGANNDFIVVSVTGIPAASNPAVPATPANAVVLYRVVVPGAAANLNGAVLFDLRPPPLAVGSGGGTWVPVTAFSTNWSNFAGFRPCAWRVDSNKRVTLRGVLMCSAALGAGTGPYGTFTLPSGARPGNTEIFAVATPTGAARMDVATSGALNLTNTGPSTGPNGFYSISGIAFDADGS
jgi:hypothetical protein